MRRRTARARGVGFLLGALLALPAPALAASPDRMPGRSAGEPSARDSSVAPDGRAAAVPSAAFHVASGPHANPAERPTATGRRYAEGVVLVGFKQGAAASARANARAAVHANAHSRVSPLAVGVERLMLPAGTSVEAAIKALQRNPAVRFAQPDYVLRPSVVPDDPGYTSTLMWGIYGPATEPPAVYGSNAAGAWSAGHFGSRSVVVGIVDTGVEINHPDLAANIWTNPFEIAGNGVDDDGNGYVDDVHGWDFYNDDASVFDGDADYHGTHVAGTIGGVGGNGEGVVGVNWAVTMIPAKFIQGEGFSSDAIAALDYLTDLKTRHGMNVVATNNSYGGDGFEPALLDAINRGGDAGILFVAAAGNDGIDTDEEPVYPQSYECTTRFDTDEPRGYDCLISVAAIDVNGFMPDFSNYGDTSVDLGAPGAQIASTFPTGEYAYMDGTSMAAPHVTGALALLAACQSAPTPSALRATLLASVTPTTSLNGNVTATGGRLDVLAMTAACTSPLAPRAVLTVPPWFVTGTTVHYTLWFSDAVTGLTAGDLSIGGSSTGWSIGTITGSGVGPYTIPLSATSPGDGSLFVTLGANAVTAGALTGPVASEAGPIVRVDRKAPTVSGLAAKAALGVAAVCPGVPLRITWMGNDFGGSGIVRYELGQSINGGPFSTISTTLAGPSATIQVSPTGSRRFRIRAVDAVDRYSNWLTGPVVTPRLTQETSSAIAYSTGWTTTSSSVYCGGAVRRASVLGKAATYSFTGRGVALLSTIAPNRGKVKVYVDGIFVTTLDLGSASTVYRRVVWERTWATTGAHKVKVVVQGTLNRPRFDADAFLTLK